MIGILIIAHAPLGSAFLTTTRHIFKSVPERLEAIDVLPDQNTNEVIELAQKAIKRLNTGDGVLILTDISGATPANCCQKLIASNQVAVLAGLNLPMLLRALNYRYKPLSVIFDMAQAGAQNGAIRLESDLRD